MFPASKTILSEDALGARLAGRYDVGRYVRCRLWLERLNDTYVVFTDRMRYVLRVYRHGWRSRAEIEGELSLLVHLASCGLPVSAPVAATDGSLYFSVDAPEGERHAALFTWAPGEVYTIQDPESYVPERVRALGRLSAQIHAAADEIEGDIPRERRDLGRLIDDPLASLADWLAHRPRDEGWLARLAGDARAALAHLPTDPPGFGLIHGDLQLANVAYATDAEPTLFDFDLCAHTWRAYDLAVFRVIAWIHLDPALAEASWQSFLEGYSEVRVPAEWEIDALPWLGVAKQIHTMALLTGIRLNTGDWWIPGFIEGRIGRLDQWNRERCRRES